MNRRAFTVMELIIAFAIVALLLSIGVVAFNNISNSATENYYHLLENNLKLSGNNYFDEHRERLPINSYNSISVKELIDNNYIEPLKDVNGNVCTEGDVYIYPGSKTTYEYEVCLKCGDYQSSGVYCGKTDEELENTNMVRIPTSSLCKRKEETTYTGSDIQLTENLGISGKYTLLNTVHKDANEAGYRITARLTGDYVWSDNTKDDKYFLCNLYRADPVITLTKTSNIVLLNYTLTYKEKANIKGTIINNIDKNKNMISIDKQNVTTNGNVDNMITVTGKKFGNTSITIEFVPNDLVNYNSIKVSENSSGVIKYDISVVNGVEKPTSEEYCKGNLVYNGGSQVLTRESSDFTFTNNIQVEAGEYDVEATLVKGKIWNDNTNTPVKIKCKIEKAKLEITCTNKEYNGSEQTIAICPGGTLNNAIQTNVGNYIIRCLGNDNYYDADDVTCSIEKTGCVKKWVYNDDEQFLWECNGDIKKTKLTFLTDVSPDNYNIGETLRYYTNNNYVLCNNSKGYCTSDYYNWPGECSVCDGRLRCATGTYTLVCE